MALQISDEELAKIMKDRQQKELETQRQAALQAVEGQRQDAVKRQQEALIMGEQAEKALARADKTAQWEQNSPAIGAREPELDADAKGKEINDAVDHSTVDLFCNLDRLTDLCELQAVKLNSLRDGMFGKATVPAAEFLDFVQQVDVLVNGRWDEEEKKLYRGVTTSALDLVTALQLLKKRDLKRILEKQIAGKKRRRELYVHCTCKVCFFLSLVVIVVELNFVVISCKDTLCFFIRPTDAIPAAARARRMRKAARYATMLADARSCPHYVLARNTFCFL